MKRLLVLDMFRGMDSTGVCAIRNDGTPHIAKVPSHPLDLFDMTKYRVAMNGTNSKVLMGHNRSATVGGVSSANAHPFEVDHIVGMHNGTLDHKSRRNLEEALDEKHSVDSLSLIAAIAKFGIKEAIEMCYEGKDYHDGAWSLVWYDGLEGSLNFLRNKHRPLWYSYSKDFKQLFWASEWPMIAAATRLGVGYELYMDDKGHRFWQTDEDVHLKFDVALLKAGSDKRPKPTAKLIKGREPNPVYTAPKSDPFKRETIPEIKARLASGTTSQTNTDGKSGSVIHMTVTDLNPLGGYISKKEFEEMAKYGCSWCQADVDYKEPGILIFERDNIVLCPACVRGGEGEGKEGGKETTRIFTKRDLYLGA